jgi:signal transduction histidine kinase
MWDGSKKKTNPERRVSLTGKLLFWVTLISTLAIISVVWASAQWANRALRFQIQGEAEAAAEEIIVGFAQDQDPLGTISDSSWVNEVLSRTYLRRGLRGVQVYLLLPSGQGHVSVGGGAPAEGALIELSEVEVGEGLVRAQNDRIEVVRRSAILGGEVAVRVMGSTEVVGTMLNIIYRKSLWIGSITWLVLVLTIAILIKRTLGRPMKRVALAMEEVAEGRLGKEIGGVNTVEMISLVEAFNKMSKQLERAELERTDLVEKVALLNQNLQQRVRFTASALSEAQADLGRRDRLAALGQMVGTIAHEVGTPLNSILAHLTLLDEELNEPEHKGRVAVVAGEIERVSEAIQGYLRSTRGPQPRSQRFSPMGLVEEVLSLYQAQAETRNISLDSKVFNGEATGDKDLIGQILRNLISNAVRACAEGGRVFVGLEKKNSGLEILVEDDGAGMSEETAAQTTKPFFSKTVDGSGIGLGMSIVHRAVEAMEGEINIDSTLNKGTAVQIFIPQPDEKI